MKNFSLIVAVGDNGVIGNSKENVMPWHIPEDLQWFKKCTTGKTVVMGSRTFESIGRPLPNRKNVVITRNAGGEWTFLQKAGVDDSFKCFQDAYDLLPDGFFVIGGSRIYREALALKPSALFITRVYGDFTGDVTFPIFGEVLNQSALTHDGALYVSTYASELKEQDGLKYQFFKFDRGN